MDVRPVHGTGEKRHGWFFDGYNQWPAILQPSKYGWHDITFTAFDVTAENSPYKGSMEVSVALLGFRGTITYVFRDEDDPDLAEFMKKHGLSDENSPTVNPNSKRTT